MASIGSTARRGCAQRPIQDLLDALRQLGADAVSEAGTGCPPVVVRAAGLPGGRAEVAGNISSQFLSAVLLAAPARQATSSFPSAASWFPSPMSR